MNICMRSFRRLRQNRVGRIYCLCYRLPLLSFSFGDMCVSTYFYWRREVVKLTIYAYKHSLPPFHRPSHTLDHSRAGPPVVLLQIAGNRTANHPFGFGYSPLSSGGLGSSRTIQWRLSKWEATYYCVSNPAADTQIFLQVAGIGAATCSVVLTSHGCSPDLIQFLIRPQ